MSCILAVSSGPRAGHGWRRWLSLQNHYFLSPSTHSLLRRPWPVEPGRQWLFTTLLCYPHGWWLDRVLLNLSSAVRKEFSELNSPKKSFLLKKKKKKQNTKHPRLRIPLVTHCIVTLSVITHWKKIANRSFVHLVSVGESPDLFAGKLYTTCHLPFPECCFQGGKWPRGPPHHFPEHRAQHPSTCAQSQAMTLPRF